jgi:hypothetical protein
VDDRTGVAVNSKVGGNSNKNKRYFFNSLIQKKLQHTTKEKHSIISKIHFPMDHEKKIDMWHRFVWFIF